MSVARHRVWVDSKLHRLVLVAVIVSTENIGPGLCPVWVREAGLQGMKGRKHWKGVLDARGEVAAAPPADSPST